MVYQGLDTAATQVTCKSIRFNKVIA